MKKVLFPISALLLFISSGCIKESSPKEIKQLQERGGACSGEFSSLEIQSIGTMHNTVVMDVFENYDFETTNIDLELRTNFASAYSSLTYNQVTNIINVATSTFDINDHTASINDPLVYSYYDDICDLLNNFSTISELNEELDKLEESIIEDLECTDRDFLLVCISVARNSSSLWAPVSIGGSGYYDDIEEKLELMGAVQYRINWRNVAEADLWGAASAFFAYGFGLAVPGTNAAIAISIAYSAGFSSVTAMAHK
ncbi:MAG: hypothetical protein LCH81_09245 [Bacteroidetes bacterium]|nr:hypothetical protein [Bacteroidota bacterium]